MAIKTEEILIVGTLLYAQNEEKGFPKARFYDKNHKVWSGKATPNGSYIGKVKSINDASDGFVFVELTSEVPTYTTLDSKDEFIAKKGKSKFVYIKLSEAGFQKGVVSAMKTKYCKGTNVNLRAGAGIAFKAIAVLSKGQPVSVTGRTLTGFTEISTLNEKLEPLKGWVSSIWLSDTIPTAEVTATVTTKKKVKKRKVGAVSTKKQKIDPAEYEPVAQGDSVEVVGEDGKIGYCVVAKDTKEINYGGIALSLIILGGLVWAGKKLFGKKTSQRQDLNAGK